MITLGDTTGWHGTQLLDRYGEKLGKLQDVYVDAATDEPMFGTVKEGRMGRHLTFVPLRAITVGTDHLQVRTTEDQVKDALVIETGGYELSQADESVLYRHYGLDYTAPDTDGGRRLARR